MTGLSLPLSALPLALLCCRMRNAMACLTFGSAFMSLPLLRTALFILFTWVLFIFKTQLLPRLLQRTALFCP